MKTTKKKALYVVAALLGALFVLSCLVGFAACGGGSTSKSDNAHQHEYTRTEVAATCTVAGKITYTCSCGDTFSETLSALGHDYTTGGEHVDATCATAGYTILTCQREGCDATREISGEAATGIHNYVATVKTAATCTTAGAMTYTCSVCENTFEEQIDALGHDLAVDSDGFYRCKREGCEAVFTEGEVVHHHDYELISQDGDDGYTAPTCTTDGVGTYKCKDCGDTQSGVTIPATGHSFSEADSNGWYKCETCGKTFNTGVDGASHEHSYSEEAYFCCETDDDGATIRRDWIAVCTADDCCKAKVLEGDELRAHTLLVYCEKALGEIENPDHGDVYGEFTAYGYYREVTDGNYKLMCDIDSELKIVRGERVTIDLNGHTLEDSITDGQHNGTYQVNMDTIRVMPGAQLTINDSSDLGTGVVDNKENGGSAIRNKEGIVTINGGTIERSLENGTSSSHTNTAYTITNFGVMTINDGAKVLSIITTENTTCGCEGECEDNCDCECGCDGDCSCDEGGCGCCESEESYELSSYSSLIEVGYGSESDLNDTHISRDTDAELIVNGGALVGGKRVKCEVLGTLEFNGGTVHGSAGAVKSYGWMTINDGSFISDDDATTPGKNYIINVDNDADSQGVREIREAESQTLVHHNYINGGTFSFNIPTDEEDPEPTSLNIRTLEDEQESEVDYYALAVTYSGTNVTENADHVTVSGGTFDGGVYVQDWAHLSISGGTINGNLKEGGIRKIGLNQFTDDGNEYVYNRISGTAHIAGDVDITVAADTTTNQESASNPLSAEEDVYFRISGGYIDGEINVTDSRTCDGVTYYKFITGGYFLNSDSAVPYIQDGHAVNRSQTYSHDKISGYYHVISSTTTDVTGRVIVPSEQFTFNNGTFDGFSGLAEDFTGTNGTTYTAGMTVTSTVDGTDGSISVVVDGVIANVMTADQMKAFDNSDTADGDALRFYVALEIAVLPGETVTLTKNNSQIASATNSGDEVQYVVFVEELTMAGGWASQSAPGAAYGVVTLPSFSLEVSVSETGSCSTGCTYTVTFGNIYIPQSAWTTTSGDEG